MADTTFEAFKPTHPERSVPNWVGLTLFLLLGLAAFGLQSLFTTPQVETWSSALFTPTWPTPPDWLFAEAWLLFVYPIVGVSGYLVWREWGFEDTKLDFALYFSMFALNILWSFLFFQVEAYGWALATMVALHVAIIATMVAFWRRFAFASLLLIIYLTMTGFSLGINWMVLGVRV